MFHQPDLFVITPPVAAPAPAPPARPPIPLPDLIERITIASARPRYTFMVLNLIARAAGRGGSAGPYVLNAGERVPIRDWLCDALVPVARRDARRLAIVAEVRETLHARGALPADPAEAASLIEAEVRERVRRSGRCNVSRAVSDLVRAGLLRRHYQGYRVDHANRGAQREAVYTLSPDVRGALGAP